MYLQILCFVSIFQRLCINFHDWIHLKDKAIDYILNSPSSLILKMCPIDQQ